jgi:hypothetical protein
VGVVVVEGDGGRGERRVRIGVADAPSVEGLATM